MTSGIRSWRELLSEYEVPDRGRAWVQIASSFGPFFLLCAAAFSLRDSLGLWSVLLAVPIAGLLLRIFILQHDCGHQSFFASRRANDVLGTFCSFFTLTPYHHWSRHHNYHHAHSGSLDHRGFHYITALTVREYRALPLWPRLRYRVYRNPWFLLGVGPILYFAILNRVPYGSRALRRNEWWSLVLCNAAVLLGVASAVAFPQVRALLPIALSAYYLAAVTGFFLFYVQHQFEGTYYTRDASWSHEAAALRGSSYLKLPPLLQWFTGNIGLHHIHHLSSRIPNYHLQRCQDEVERFHSIPSLTLRAAFATCALRLWDENAGRMVALRAARGQGAAA